ncbi:MAG: TnsA endonuclease N-terminal domain-containing protein [Rhodopirellula sp.]|nr:TnsA endonuclease N-terminal domain-containing protein [Rhodopirellula sp.]
MPSDREGRCIRCQGQLEAAAARVLVASPGVNALQEQPLQVWYERVPNHPEIRLITRTSNECRDLSNRHATKLRTYVVPDFLVRMQDGRLVLIEVKPSRKLDKPDIVRKLKVASLFAQSNGW